MSNMKTTILDVKEPAKVRGNLIRCGNYSMCPLCYGCRNYNSLDLDCLECKNDDDIRGRKYNICKTSLHEEWKINKIINKRLIECENKITFISNKEN